MINRGCLEKLMKPTILLHNAESLETRGRVCVIGLGCIGLPTAAVLAKHGYQVHGVDVRSELVDEINLGQVDIPEPGLSELIREVVSSGRLTASLRVTQADVFVLCVPTPLRHDNQPDVSFVETAAQAIRPHVRSGNLILVESTCPPRTTEDVVCRNAVPDHLVVGDDVFVAYCPERVFPTHIIDELVRNDRIVGGLTARCAQQAGEFYRTFVLGQVLTTNAVTAEITKLVENAYRDVNIAFANEIGALVSEAGADVFEVIELANHHPRVNVLSPGPGVGGHCIPIDPWFLARSYPHHSALMQTARRINDVKPSRVAEQVKNLVQAHRPTAVGCLGLAYKADVDDMRGSPCLEIVNELRRSVDEEVLVCEPFADENDFPELSLCPLDEVLQRCEIIVLLTDHAIFRSIPGDVLAEKILVDPRGAWRATTADAGGADSTRDKLEFSRPEFRRTA